ncbi:MAG: transposase [Bacteroidetes bacterium]|nr:transposase [Bacteroidota bacterium]
MKAVDKQLDDYLKKLQENDIKEDLADELDNVEECRIDTHVIDKIAKLQKKVEELEEQKKFLEQEKRNSYSPTDPDARLMKTRNGMVPAYNTQYATDEEYHMIALAEVETDESDVNLLNPVIEKMNEQINMIPDATLADKGYYKLTEIKKTEKENKTECYVAVQEESQKKKDQTAGISFVYNKKKDEYKCSQGKRLVLIQKNKKKRSKLTDVYQGIECKGCLIKNRCTNSKHGRMIHRFHDQEWADAYRRKIRSQKGKTMVKLRKNIVEHPFGTMGYWMGKIPLLLRGKSKVQAEIDIYSTGYNLIRLKNIDKTENIIKMIEKYDWKAAA